MSKDSRNQWRSSLDNQIDLADEGLINSKEESWSIDDSGEDVRRRIESS